MYWCTVGTKNPGHCREVAIWGLKIWPHSHLIPPPQATLLKKITNLQILGDIGYMKLSRVMISIQVNPYITFTLSMGYYG